MKLSTFLESSVHSFEVDHPKKPKALGYDGIDFCFHPSLFRDGKEESIIARIKEKLDEATGKI